MDPSDRESEPLSRTSPRLRWTEPEVAWPIALVAGFLGAYVGIAIPVPGMGMLVAVLAFAPLYLVLQRRGRVRLAAVLAAGWIFGVGAATCAAVLDSTFSRVAEVVPGAWRFRDGELAPWLSGGTGVEGSEWTRALRNAGILAGILAVARPSRGLLSLLALGGAATAVGAGVGWFVDLALEQGGEPALLALMAVPPHYAFLTLGAALLATVVADARPLFGGGRADGVREFDPHRRQLLAAGSVLAILGLALDPLLAARWGAWLGSTIGNIRW